MKIYKNGRFESEGFGSAVQGNPLTAVAWLANTLGEHGILFKAGEVILSGSLAPLITVVAGDEMSLEIEGQAAVAVGSFNTMAHIDRLLNQGHLLCITSVEAWAIR